MDISYKWLVELTGLDWSPVEMADRLTLCGTACEHIEPTDRYLDKVVIGHVTDILPIEGADKIKKAVVDIGVETLELVCGAPNVAAGQKVPIALVGAKLAGGFEIKRAKIRGIVSVGMICSERELGISDDHTGIWVLPDDAPVGDLLAAHINQVQAAQVEAGNNDWAVNATQELIVLLRDDYPTLMSVVSTLGDAIPDTWNGVR